GASGAGHQPLPVDAAIDWAMVETARVSFLAGENYTAAARPSNVGAPEELARRAALVSYYGRGDLAAARDAWSQRHDPPRDPAEAAMTADLEADVAGAGALAAIERLRAFAPGEADTMLAALRLRQSDGEGTTRAAD